MFIKQLDPKKGELEIELQMIATMRDFAPIVWDTEIIDNKLFITMDDLGEGTLVDKYGEDPEEIPEEVWDEIRNMVKTLYEEEGIEYVDITPYNFIERNGKIYMIDFGDARYISDKPDWFLSEFLEGENSWNPDYK